jgi:hypothetical protein
LDNLTVKINNIHFRFEDTINHFAWGFTLQKLDVETFDDNWMAPQFFRRAAGSAGAAKPVNK